jgi:hypothetical protein
MPSKTKAQHNLMAMVANDPAASKRLGIPQKVGKEFMQADKGRKFNQGGEMKESKAMMGKEIAFMKKKGAPKSMIKHEMAEAKGMKKGGYASGGMPMVMKDGKKVPAFAADGEGKMKAGGMAKKMMGGGMAYKAGGLSPGHKAADGIAKKGKTKGEQVKMMRGGKC